MSEAKHTHGAWKALAPFRSGEHWVVGTAVSNADPRHYIIAKIHNGAPGDTLETEEANALIMAAAPELLTACEGLLAEYEAIPERMRHNDCSRHMRILAAAIAKAKGAPPCKP